MRLNKGLFSVGWMLAIVGSLVAQEHFEVNTNLVVRAMNNSPYSNAWSGGMNHVQFSEVDLNMDGINDLFVFDRAGDRISTFINSGIANTIDYSFAPQYKDSFPELRDWVLFRDYNCDGKMDIFTYSSGGMAVYENTSNGSLSFQLVTSLLKSNYNPDTGTNFINLYVSSTDIPAIDDIDNDGDLDVLTFSILGNYVEYHKNLSQELYGTCDSLIFNAANKCWGFFSENLSNNSVTLNDTCAQNVVNPEKIEEQIAKNKHAGSTLLTLDVDDNGSKDLVLGDVSFNNMTLLYNTDVSVSLNQSNVTNQDNGFPSNINSTLPVNLKLFPAGFYLDVNNDNVKDLIVTTNCNSGCENAESSWLYLNEGTNSAPEFNYIKNNFLQDEMIELGESTHPVFFDYNADGLLDIVVGNTGFYDTTLTLAYHSSLHLYENIGTSNAPEYKLVDEDYIGISNMNLDLNGGTPTLGLMPTFGDLDGDNDEDMMLGDYLGKLYYFENTAGQGNQANFVLNTVQYEGIDIGSFAAPQLIDLNRDGKLDLVIGKNNGYFSYYENTGTINSPSHTNITDSLGYASTLKSGFFQGNSEPNIIDENGSYILFSGSLDGGIYVYDQIENNLNGTFNRIDSVFLNINEGEKTSIAIADINDDDRNDLLIGNAAGGLSYYEGAEPPVFVEELENPLDIEVFPNPTKGYVSISFKKKRIETSSISLIDMFGRTLLSKTLGSNQIDIDMGNYAVGIYFVQVSNAQGTSTTKIIKQ